MNKDQFLKSLASLFEVTPESELNWLTDFKNLEEWDSLLALEVIAMIDEEFNIEISGDDIREAETFEDLYITSISK